MHGTGLTQNTVGRIPDNPLGCPGYCVPWTNLDTFAATDAALRAINSLGRNRYPFWIVTPAARQRATFKEYRGANARAVMNGIFFYIKYDAFGHH
jgi:hypothetical protein